MPIYSHSILETLNVAKFYFKIENISNNIAFSDKYTFPRNRCWKSESRLASHQMTGLVI